MRNNKPTKYHVLIFISLVLLLGANLLIGSLILLLIVMFGAIGLLNTID